MGIYHESARNLQRRTLIFRKSPVCTAFLTPVEVYQRLHCRYQTLTTTTTSLATNLRTAMILIYYRVLTLHCLGSKASIATHVDLYVWL